jgi:hypothetical protein
VAQAAGTWQCNSGALLGVLLLSHSVISHHHIAQHAQEPLYIAGDAPMLIITSLPYLSCQLNRSCTVANL